MPYTLGGLTLPNPKKFTRNFVETGAENLLMEGKTTKRVENRKERFILEYQNLTSAEVNSILSIYELGEVVTFTVDETNLTIGPTDVLMDIGGREYITEGKTYKESFNIILSEIF